MASCLVAYGFACGGQQRKNLVELELFLENSCVRVKWRELKDSSRSVSRSGALQPPS